MCVCVCVCVHTYIYLYLYLYLSGGADLVDKVGSNQHSFFAIIVKSIGLVRSPHVLVKVC